MPTLKGWNCFANTLTSEFRRLPYKSDMHKFSTLYEPREIVVTRRMTRRTFHAEDPHIRIRHHCTKFSCPGDLAPGTCAPVMLMVLTVGNSEALHKCCRRMWKSEVNICLWRKIGINTRMNVKSCVIDNDVRGSNGGVCSRWIHLRIYQYFYTAVCHSSGV